MKVLVTGADGFIGKNLCLKLSEFEGVEIFKFLRGASEDKLAEYVGASDIIFHLAGENRPVDEAQFAAVNVGLTQTLCRCLMMCTDSKTVVFSSSTQVDRDNPYGESKRGAEDHLCDLNKSSNHNVHIYRLPNVFGKWCRPEYNSVVATFCHNISRKLPIQVNNPDTDLNLVYIDDVISCFVGHILSKSSELFQEVKPLYSITLGKLVSILNEFENIGESLIVGDVGAGLMRALYATYVSYLPSERFVYSIPSYCDDRGVFVEMLKTQKSGQFSFFTAKPGVTRGSHYHHTKTEKFLVIKGSALFRFKHVLSGERYEYEVKEGEYKIVETIPGWAHDITNIGENELIVMLWANEIFERDAPDTYARGLE